MVKLFASHRPKAAKPRKSPPPSGQDAARATPKAEKGKAKPSPETRPKEIGGPSGPEPTRYGDWERNGICVDF